VKEPKCLVLKERVWTYHENKQSDTYGTCDTSQRRIYVDKRLVEKAKVSAQCHEIFHALLPDLTEDAILRLEKEFVNAACELRMNFKRRWLDD
jgi:hypothetical protein